MRAVKHRLFNVLAAASLMLCLATVAVWVNSFRRVDMFVLPVGKGAAISTARGAISFGWIGPRNGPPPGPSPSAWHHVLPFDQVIDPHPNLIQYNLTGGFLLLAIPCWLVALLAL